MFVQFLNNLIFYTVDKHDRFTIQSTHMDFDKLSLQFNFQTNYSISHEIMAGSKMLKPLEIKQKHSSKL